MITPIWTETRWRPGVPWCSTCASFHPRGQLDGLDLAAALVFAAVMWLAWPGRRGPGCLVELVYQSIAIARCIDGQSKSGRDIGPY